MRRASAAVVAALAAGILIAIPGTAGAGGGCMHEIGASTARSTTVVLSFNCLTPTITWIAPHQTVTWINKDDVVHNVTGTAFKISSEELSRGARYSFTFDNVGIFAYSCTIHEGMVGAVVVGAPVAPTSAVAAPNPNSGYPGSTVTADEAKPVTAAAATTTTPRGKGPLAATLAGVIAAALGFAIGRTRRTRPEAPAITSSQAHS